MTMSASPSSSSRSSNAHHSRILFGSCNSQGLDQPLWPAVIARNASAFVWGGDAVYADSKIGRKEIPATPEDLAQAYRQQLLNPGYQQVLRQNMTIVGTYDDHDFGINNGCTEYAHKMESATMFVKFLEESSHRPFKLMSERVRQDKGMYAVVVFDFTREHDPLVSDEEAGIDPDIPLDPEKEKFILSDKSVAIFLLDIRYNKTPWGQASESYLHGDFQGDFLGEKQWKWLEEGLARSTARANIVVSGLQVHVDRYFWGRTVEEWSRYPMAQHRLYQALLQPNVQSPFIVSGDVHMAEFLRRDCRRITDTTSHRSLMEVTTSGMTHSWGTNHCPRVDKTKPIPYSCSWYVRGILHAGMHLAHWSGSWTELVHDLGPQTEGVKRRRQYSLDRNFAEFDFDWDDSKLTVRILGQDTALPPQLSMTWDFRNLSSSGLTPTGKLMHADFERRYAMLAEHSGGGGITKDDWICLPYGGYVGPVRKAWAPGLSFVWVTSLYTGPVWLPVSFLIWFCFLRRCGSRKEKSD